MMMMRGLLVIPASVDGCTLSVECPRGPLYRQWLMKH